MKKRSVLIILLAAIFLNPYSFGQQQPSLFKRKILALYKSSEEMTEEYNDIRAMCEFPLNHLGLVVEYYDIDKGLPGDAYMRNFRGIITFFYSNEMPNAQAYCDWVRDQVVAGRKFIILNDFGAFIDSLTNIPVDTREINRVFHALGLDFGHLWTADKRNIALVKKDPGMIDFEKSIREEELIYYIKISAIHPESKVYFQLRRRDIPESISDIAVITPFGGVVYGPYTYFENPQTHKRQWHLNPFKFFAYAFDVISSPRMDVSTLNGKRILFSHIDGDGFRNLSYVEKDMFCSEIIRDNILKTHDLPFSVSVITGDIDPQALGSKKLVQIAKDVFSLPNVEPASHSFSHPHIWRTGESDLKISGYTFDLQKEIRGSVEYINSCLLSGGKTTTAFFWTGDCAPTGEALRLTEEIGIKNFNSEPVTRFDKEFPSHCYLTPLVSFVDGEMKFNNRASNDYIYTNHWTKPRDGFVKVIETFKNTDKETTLIPINVYYHFYSGEYRSSLNALKKVYYWCLSQEIAPIWVSQYIGIVEGFLQTEILKYGERVWEIRNNGNCRTVRFDNSMLYPNFEKSENIIGFTHRHKDLYIFLNDKKKHKIVLSDISPKGVYLKKASCIIDKWDVSSRHISFIAEGWKGKFSIANMLPLRYYKIFNHSSRETIFVYTGFNGDLDFQIKIRERNKLTINLSNKKMLYFERFKITGVIAFVIIFIIILFLKTKRHLFGKLSYAKPVRDSDK